MINVDIMQKLHEQLLLLRSYLTPSVSVIFGVFRSVRVKVQEF